MNLVENQPETALSIVPRFSTSVTAERPFYGGAQTFIALFPSNMEYVGNVGVFFGYETLLSERTGIQFELAFSPFNYSEFETFWYPNATLSGAFQWRFGQGAADPG